MNNKLVGITLFMALSTGCSGDGDSVPSTGQASQEPSILGLWSLNSSPSTTDNTEAYFEITSDQVNYYFYQGNKPISNANCYTLESKALAHLTSNNTITATEEELTISFVDADDEDDDGNTTEIIVEKFPRVVNINVADINLCT